MRTFSKLAIVLMIATVVTATAYGQAHEFAITAGGNFPKNDQYNPGNSFAVGAQYDGRIAQVPFFSLYLDVPLAVATKSSFTDPSCISPCTFKNNYRSFFFTPGLKLRFGAPLVPVAPYVVAGAGFAHYNVPDAAIFGNNSSNKAAFEVGAGVDMKVAPFFSIRGEVRDFISGTPDIAAITQSGKQHNVVPQVGLVFRF